MLKPTTFALLCLLVLSGCKKQEPELVTDNQAPYYDGIATVVVRNYVNRLFIDLIGREPLNVEMDAEVTTLESAGLATNARQTLVTKLMTNTDFVQGDSSYKHAYYQRQYDLFKARCLEGASDAQIDQEIGIVQFQVTNDSISGDSAAYQQSRRELDKLKNLKGSRTDYMNGTIGIAEVHFRMVYNSLYDFINMNSFNFINATFDDLYTRFPTQSEFDAAYNMVELSAPDILFGLPAQNKQEYVEIVTTTAEFDEGMVRWCYRTFLGRDASTYEVYQMLQDFATDHDLQNVQQRIMTTDEYANFD